MRNLFRQIAGANFIVALAAPEGLLLDTLGDSSFGETGGGTAIRPGALWAEARCGANALGASAVIGRPITVHGDQHFFRGHTGLSCSSAPLLTAARARAIPAAFMSFSPMPKPLARRGVRPPRFFDRVLVVAEKTTQRSCQGASRPANVRSMAFSPADTEDYARRRTGTQHF
jgi:hypothetical protein